MVGGQIGRRDARVPERGASSPEVFQDTSCEPATAREVCAHSKCFLLAAMQQRRCGFPWRAVWEPALPVLLWGRYQATIKVCREDRTEHLLNTGRVGKVSRTTALEARSNQRSQKGLRETKLNWPRWRRPSKPYTYTRPRRLERLAG